MSNLSKWLIGGAAFVVIVILAVVYGGGGGAPSGTPPETSSTAGGTPASTSTTGPATPPAPSPTPSNSPAPAPSPSPTVPPVVIKFITPVPNDQWKIGTQYPISWNNEAGVTGEIDLLNASDKSEVGVILSETGPHQTSYSWNARDYFLARYNPLKKNVTPGPYLIEMKFDGNNLPNIISGPVNISN